MSSSLYFKQDLSIESKDFLFSFADTLFSARLDKNKSLEDVSLVTGISVEEIDALECYLGDINFEQAMKLLDYYMTKLEVCCSCFPGLPSEIYDKYFENES